MSQPPYGSPDPNQPYPQQPSQPQQPFAQHNPYEQEHQATPKKGNIRKIISIVVTVVLVGSGAYALWNRWADNAALKEGQCIVITGEDKDNVNHKAIDCAKSETYSYLITNVQKGDASCGDALPYEISENRRRGASNVTKTACLVPNFSAGTCYDIVDDSVWEYEVADCASAEFKITKISESATETCDTPAEPWSFSDPARTYCVEKSY